MTSGRRQQIIESLQDKEYRDIFVSEEIDTGLPLQIRAMRQARGWSQKELAKRVDMTQEGVSRLESLSYGKFTLTTLKRLASAFDVGLMVTFVSFSRLVDWTANLDSEDMAIPDFEHDPGFVPFVSRQVHTAHAMTQPSRSETRPTVVAELPGQTIQANRKLILPPYLSPIMKASNSTMPWRQ